MALFLINAAGSPTDAANGESRKAKKAAYIVDVLVNCEPGAGVGPAKAPRLLSASVKGSPLVVPFPLEQVTARGHFVVVHHRIT